MASALIIPKNARKPRQWDLTPSRVDSKWRWAWRDAQFVLPIWEGVLEPRDLVRGIKPSSISGTPAIGRNQYGHIVDFSPLNSESYRYNQLGPVNTNTSGITLLCIFEPNAATGDGFFISKAATASATYDFGVYRDGGALVMTFFYGANQSRNLGGFDTTTLRRYVFAISAGTDGVLAVLDDLTHSSAGITLVNNNEDFYVAGHVAAADFRVNAKIELACWINRPWTLNQLRAWKSDPYGMFRPKFNHSFEPIPVAPPPPPAVDDPKFPDGSDAYQYQ